MDKLFKVAIKLTWLLACAWLYLYSNNQTNFDFHGGFLKLQDFTERNILGRLMLPFAMCGFLRNLIIFSFTTGVTVALNAIRGTSGNMAGNPSQQE